jgi:hypothetical protein
MGGKKGKKGTKAHQANQQRPAYNQGEHGKKDERRARAALRREERLKQWHDPKWKQEFTRFEAQLKALGLRIADQTGGMCCVV